MKDLPPPRARKPGLYDVDLTKEAKRAGVPYWFMQDSSKKKRIKAWSALPRAPREQASPPLPVELRDSSEQRLSRDHALAWHTTGGGPT